MTNHPLEIGQPERASTGRASNDGAFGGVEPRRSPPPPSDRGADLAGETQWLRQARGYFLSTDLRALAALRIGLGALLVFDLVSRLPFVEALYSNDGVLSNHFSLYRPLAPFQFSLYAAHSSSRDVTVAFVLTLVVYLLFTVGYRTRLFHLLSFVCVTSLHARNLMTELASDVPLHVMLGWSLFLPLGSRFSIDASRASLRRPKEASVEELNLREDRPSSVTSIAVFGLLLQISAMHVVAALRQSGAAWQDGSALYYALRQNLWVTDFGSWVAAHASLSELRIASFGYRALELTIGLAVLVPVVWARRASIALLLALHLGSLALWNVGPYEWVMLAGIPLLLPAGDWDRLATFYRARKHRVTIVFNPASGLAFTCCRLLRRLDVLDRLRFMASAGPLDRLVVRDETSGEISEQGRAAAVILGTLPLGAVASLVLRLPGLTWLADRIVERSIRRSAPLSAWFGLKGLAASPVAPAPAFDDSALRSLARARARVREALAFSFLVVCGVALARDMGDETVPGGVEGIAYRAVAYPRLFQRWGLFAPEPEKRPGTLVAEAQTATGEHLDPLTGRAAPSRRPHPLMAAYYTNISQPSRAVYVNEFREYVRRLDSRRGPSEKAIWFNVDWVEAPIPAPEPTDEAPVPIALAPISRRITSGP
jgi:hypothetical protein